jgi:putative hydrolase of the HAD superfamily
MSIPESILIDLDDTLYSSVEPHKLGLRAAGLLLENRIGLELQRTVSLYSQSRERVKSRLGPIASSHSRLLYFKDMLENLGLSSRLELAIQLESTYWGAYLRAMALFPQAKRFLETCRGLGVPVFVVSDLTCQIQIRKLVQLNLLSLVDGLISSEDVGVDKPHDAFLEYFQENFLQAPQGAWVVGDNHYRDGGLAERMPGAEFFLVTQGRLSEPRVFFKLIARLNAESR